MTDPAPESQRVRVAPAADLPEGTCRQVESGGRAVLVTIVDGHPYAVDDACLHKAGSLSGGVVRDGSVTCPLHWWRYDLRTGALHGSESAGLATYECRVSEDGWVEVDVPPAPPARSWRELLLEHAREGRPSPSAAGG
ncbi:MAG: Rieske (2Fe-2S) protein [Candidatus Nanopelagicales bacterium]